MTKFFLSLVAIGVAMLIGAFVILAFRPQDPFLHRPQYLRAAPTYERTLTPPPDSSEPPQLAASVIGPAPASAVPNAAGVSVPEPPIPGDCQRREQQQGDNFFRV